LGYTPFPGTLNVELSEASIRGRADLSAQASVPIDSWEDDERTFGAATCYPARLEANGRQYGPTHVIVPDRTHHDEESLELIAPEKLRDELNLTDDDTLSIHLEEASTE
jgi:riboflavin kinase